MPALGVLLDAYEQEAQLNVFGAHAAKWDVLRCLSNLLRFDAEEEQDPGVLAEPIEAPIFITGLPRAGTTLLHSLLAEDAMLLVPRCWQTMSPYPGGGRDARRQRVESQLRMFQRLAPEIASLHALSADAPQECTEITAQVFQSVRYEATHRVPSYQRWLDSHGHLAAYRFHKRFLQHLQHQSRALPWVLKCPDHIHALKAIDAVYPDARFVFFHRDPLHVIASASKLTEVLRRPFTRKIDKGEIGRQVTARVREAAEVMISRSRATSERILHIHYLSFSRNPLGTVEQFYSHFGMQISEATRGRIAAHLVSARTPKNRYDMNEFGLEPSELCRQFMPYVEQFGVARELAAWNTASAHASLAA
ncbi:MAG: sulfotransferase [Alphaproteobacteria bacterium]|nr:sulfotransferase [Alphaproteobacteria bacterium]